MSGSELASINWISDFAGAESRWLSLDSDPPGDDEALLGLWRSEFDAMVARQNTLRTAGSWLTGPHDLLAIVGLHRWERAHSAALGWLLDPAGGHGLGPGLLDEFLSAASLARHGDEPVEVVLEADGGTSLADVLIRSPSWTLVIEVKVDASEQLQQAYRLWSDWRGHPGAAFVYLTPSGRATTTHASEECAAAWTLISWRSVVRSLHALLAASPMTAQGSGAALQYAMTLRSLFGRG